MYIFNNLFFINFQRIKKIILSVSISLFFSLSLHAQSLTLYVIPPKKPMDWRSPKALLFSYVKSYMARTSYKKYPHPMGHVIVELEDSSRYTLSGMVAQSTKPQMQMVWKKGYGLGILTAVSPGMLRENKPNADDLQLRYPTGDVAFIRYALSPDLFNHLWHYLQEYKAYGFDAMYNGENKPREGKGAGCSAFGVSFLEVAGLLNLEQKSAWEVEVRVQKELLGGPLHHHRRVGLTRIAFTKKWANKNDTSAYTIRYYEPHLMYNWIQHEYQKLIQNSTPQASASLKWQAKGCEFDCKFYPVPDESIWQFQDMENPVYSTKKNRKNSNHGE